MTMLLKNNNGIDYRILKLIPFNNSDKDYYKDSWQKYRFGLLQHEISPTLSRFIVASMVGENEWGNGSYFDDLEPAKDYLEKLEKEYRL